MVNAIVHQGFIWKIQQHVKNVALNAMNAPILMFAPVVQMYLVVIHLNASVVLVIMMIFRQETV